VWTEARIELLIALHLDGLSFSKIAIELGGGITRNACIGKANRLGLSRGSEGKPRIARKRSDPKPPPSVARTTRQEEASRVERLKIANHFIQPVSRQLSIFELSEGTCKWPIGDPKQKGFHFCGAFSPTGRVYCPYHNKQAYQEPKPRKPRAYHR
jgi:GcrA cell cycle regulator